MRKKTFFKGVLLLLLLMLLPLGAFGQLITGTTATASTGTASAAVDGNAGTRWESAQADPQWIIVDLGAEYNVAKVELIWEGASASDYTLEGSTNNTDWTIIDTKTGLAGARTDEITGINTTYRYIKMNGTARSTVWGYSIWEFKVYQAAVPELTTVEVSPATTSVLPGETKQFTAVGKDQLGDPFTFTNTTTWSVNGSGCTIGTDGLLTTTVDGNYTITATNTGKSGTASLTVYTPELTTLNITPANASVNAGNTQQFNFTGKDQLGENMAIVSQTWTVSGADCSIDNNGLLTTAASASGYFYATVTANGSLGTVSKNVYFSVGNYAKGATVTASSGNGALAVDGDAGSRWESAASDPQSLIIDMGASKNIGVIRIAWEGANSKDYTIGFSNTNNGTDWADVITKTDMAGGARVDVISNLDLNYQYIKIEGTARNLTYGHSIFEFEVYGKTAPFLSSVVVIPSTATMTAGETQSFTAEGRDQNGNVFALTGTTNWSVNGVGASIDANGLLTTTKPGTYTVKGTNSSYSGTASVDVLPSDANIAIGKPAIASTGNAAAAFDDDAGTRWESASADPQSIVVDLGVINNITGVRIVWEAANAKNYIVEGSNDSIDWTTFINKTNMPVGARTDAIYDLVGCNYRYVRLTGTTRNTGYGYSIWEFKIYGATKTAPVITWENPEDITYSTLLSSTELNATTDVDGTFTYIPALDFKMNAGLNQELRVDFKPTDELTYASATKIVHINVNKVTPVITWASPADINYGVAISATQLNASADVDGSFAYTVAIDSVLNAGSNQDITVEFTPTNTVNYNSVSKTVSINVNKANPVITWAVPADITYGTAISESELNATADVDGAFNYSVAIDSVLNAGDAQNLNVEFTPTDEVNYNVVSKYVQINVKKALPVITWATPSDITYGALLSATQLNATANAEGTFTYTPSLNEQLNAGDAQNLKVDFVPSEIANYELVSKTVQINVNKATPEITWSIPSDIAYGTLLSVTQLDASTTIGGTFAYTPAISTKLDAGNSQNLSVEFTPTDADNYNSASKTVQINVTKANPVITWNSPDDIVSGTALSATQLNASSLVAGTFVYSPISGDILTIGDNQTLSVEFTPTDATNYNVVSKSVTINVLDPGKTTPVITWTNPSDITYGELLSATQLNATSGGVAGTYTYTPALDSKLDAGSGIELKVVFTPSDASSYNAASKTVHINVLKATPVITWENPSAISYGTFLSASQLNATADVTGTFVYDPALGTKLEVGSDLDLTVDFTPTDINNYNTASKTVKITVTNAIPVITWNNPADIVYETLLSSTQLNATSGNVAGTFTYTPAIGTKLAAGSNIELKVDFTPTDAVAYSSTSKTVNINVLKATSTISWAVPSDIVYGETLSDVQLNASANVAGEFTYTPAIGAKLASGVNQELTVEFVPTDASYTTISKTVKINVQQAVSIITWANPSDIVYGTLLSINQLNATANIVGTFTYAPAIDSKLNVGANIDLKVDFVPTDASYTSVSKIVKINVTKVSPVITWAVPADIAYGTLLSDVQLNAASDIDGTFVYTPAIGTKLNAGLNQDLKVEFTPTDLTNYNVPASKTVKINVSKITSVINWETPADIAYGTTLDVSQLNATVEGISGTFVYTPALGSKPNAGSAQDLQVVFTPDDAVNYTSESKTVKINVSKVTPVITWENPAEITYGAKLTIKQLNAGAGNASGVFVYTPDLNSLLNAGADQELKVDFTPNDLVNYNVVSKTVKINVAKATPVITWSNPADITEGTALNASQLNASANIDGTLVYTPAAGSILSVGSAQALKVDFTPTDAVNFNSISKTVKINVLEFVGVPSASSANVLVYPNPCAEKLTIVNAGAFSKVVVCDMMGKTVLTTNIFTDKTELNLSNLSKGNYILVLSGKNAKETLSIIKR